ncbi:MAG: hypothetical protein ACXV3U_05805 [Halobacteriota archaeon]
MCFFILFFIKKATNTSTGNTVDAMITTTMSSNMASWASVNIIIVDRHIICECLCMCFIPVGRPIIRMCFIILRGVSTILIRPSAMIMRRHSMLMYLSILKGISIIFIRPILIPSPDYSRASQVPFSSPSPYEEIKRFSQFTATYKQLSEDV